MLPKIWGKAGWDFFHLVILAYPENPTESDKIRYYNYLYWFQFILPCNKCQFNLQHHLKLLPITNETLASRNNFIKWGIDLHNMVNASIGKPSLSYEEAIDAMKNINNQEKSNCNIYLCIIIIIVIIFIFLFIFFKKN